MFVIFGWGRSTRRILGWALSQMCPRCHNQRPWAVVRIRRWFTLFFIPVFPYASRYLKMCPVCSFGFETDKAGARELIQSPREIPTDEGPAQLAGSSPAIVACEASTTGALVATFNETTGWPGRTITFEKAQGEFILQEHGPITARDVLNYDVQGQIEWAQWGQYEWVYDCAEWERTHAPAPGALDQQPSGSTEPSESMATGREAGGPVATPTEDRALAYAKLAQARFGGQARPPHRRRRAVIAGVGVAVALVIAVGMMTSRQSPAATSMSGSSRSATASVTSKPSESINQFMELVGRVARLNNEVYSHPADYWAANAPARALLAAEFSSVAAKINAWRTTYPMASAPSGTTRLCTCAVAFAQAASAFMRDPTKDTGRRYNATALALKRELGKYAQGQ